MPVTGTPITATSTSYNYFGATYDQAVDMFPETVAADFGSQTLIEAVMLRIETEIVSNCNQWILNGMRQVIGMPIELHADDSQTVIDVVNAGGVNYGCASNIEVWVNYAYRPAPPSRGEGYTDGDGMAVTSNSGAIRITMTTALSEGDEVIMSCDLDPSNSAFSVESLKNVILSGSAARCGLQAYTPEESPLIDIYKKEYETALKNLAEVNNQYRFVPEFARRNELHVQVFNGEMVSGEIYK